MHKRGETVSLLENMHAYKQTKMHQPRKATTPPSPLLANAKGFRMSRVSRDWWVFLKRVFVGIDFFLGVKVNEVWMVFHYILNLNG